MSLNSTPEAFATLQRLRDEEKFAEEDFYPGAPTEDIRLQCEAKVNQFIDEVRDILSRSQKKEEIFQLAKALQAKFEGEDTEEREKVDDYVGETMRALGLDDWTDHV